MRNSQVPLQAVLFDMDGTLVDTEPLWLQAEAAYCAQYGKPWAEEDAVDLVGQPARFTTDRLRERTESGESHEEIFAFLENYLVDAIRAGQAPMRPGMPELVAELQEAGIPLALVTSSVRPMAQAVLDRLAEDTFAVVITADDVTTAKPHPEPYAKAIRELGVNPAFTIALEDSVPGVTSASEAGAKVVAIPSVVPIPAMPGVEAVASAEELDLETLRSLLLHLE